MSDIITTSANSDRIDSFYLESQPQDSNIYGYCLEDLQKIIQPTFRSKQGVCEVYVNSLWVEKECDPEVRMSTTLWHHRPDGVYEQEKFVPPMVQNELTIETEKEVKAMKKRRV